MFLKLRFHLREIAIHLIQLHGGYVNCLLHIQRFLQVKCVFHNLLEFANTPVNVFAHNCEELFQVKFQGKLTRLGT
jgi:hypothetical protein